MRKPGAVSGLWGFSAVVLAGLVLLGGGTGEALAADLEVDGMLLPGGGVQWTSGGKPAATVAVNPGDTVVWKAVSGKHGVVFDTQAAAEAFLTFQTGGSLPALGAQTVMGEVVWGTAPQAAVGAGTLLAQATVKAGVAPGTNLGFFCSQHGRMMSGSLAVPAAPATVEIDGVLLPGGGVQWTSGGKPAATVAVNPGDTVVWKAVSGKHGVVFNTQALAEAFLTFQTGGTLPALGPQTVQGELVWGTAPQAAAGAGTLLAQTTVKAGLAPGTPLGFFCSQHGRMMSGSLAVAGDTPPSPPSPDNSPRDPGGLDDPRIKRVVRAEVVALDQAFLCNRLGGAMPQGMIFA